MQWYWHICRYLEEMKHENCLLETHSWPTVANYLSICLSIYLYLSIYLSIYLRIYILHAYERNIQTWTSHVHINPITTCILVHPGLIKTHKQFAYICEETGCSPDLNISRIVFMKYWYQCRRVMEPFLDLVLAGN